MNTLIRFEDTYGMYDISSIAFGYKDNIDDETIIRNNGTDTVKIEHGVGNSKIFSPIIEEGIDRLVIVFDMDGTGVKENKILTAESLRNKCNRIINAESIDIKLVPIVFCAETIMLHRFLTSTADFSTVYSGNNTAHMHLNILRDTLTKIYTFDKYRKMWVFNQHTENYEFRTKKMRDYLGTYEEMEDVMNALLKDNVSVYNHTYFKWFLSKDLFNTDNLMGVRDAIIQQHSFEELFKKEINDGHTFIDINGVYYT
ncbi:MAG: hypothetical protein IJ593_10990 [Lachnospiraceae bacterium]|nr:hypothetical protein [Lachnospiraceae bacterium]